MRGTKRTLATAGLALALVASPMLSSAADAATFRARIVDNAFRPRTITIVVGDTVRWRNNGMRNHTVTANSGAFDSGILNPTETFMHTFDVAGTVRYHCEIHDEMRGRVIVNPA